MTKSLQVKTKKIFSIITTLALIMQVVLPGVLFNFDIREAEAAVTIAVNPPGAGTEWDIGDVNEIVWSTVVSDPDVQPDYFKLYYSEDSGSSWISIDDNVAWSGSPQTYNWTTPVVNGAGESDFQIKVESYLNSDPDTPTGTGTSDDFIIDYGPLDSLSVDAPDELTDNPAIDISITAKDQYSNFIINYNDTSLTWACEGGGSATCVPISGPVTVVWDNGVAITNLPAMELDIDFSGDTDAVSEGSITFIIGGGEYGFDDVTWIQKIVLVDTPTSTDTWVTDTTEDIIFRAGGEITPDFLKVYYSSNSGGDFFLIDDNVIYGSQPQTYSWNIPKSVLNPGQQVFQIKVESHTTASGLITSGTSDSFIITGENTGGSQPPPDLEPPTSKVIGILEDGIITSPLPNTIYQSEFTIIAEAEDESGIKQVELFWSQEPTENYQSHGLGVLTPISGTDYWTWDLDTQGLAGNGQYYFYSEAIDNASSSNIEIIPKSWWPASMQYDDSVLVSVINPKIIITSPIHNETNIGIDSNIKIVFDYAMDRYSVEQAFSVVRTDGAPNDLAWNASWSNLDRTVVFSHIPNFSYQTEYKSWVDPSIAKSIYGNLLDAQSAKPNPWIFTTALMQSPDLTTSTKEVNMDIASAGDRLTYTIELKNTDTKNANVTFIDTIPANTVYDNYVRNAKYNKKTNQIYWSGRLRLDRPRIITFRVQILSPLPNDTIILNEAVFDDGENPSISRFAETIIQSPAAVIMLTSPMASEQQVSIIPNIRAVFDQTMDRALVEQAFSVVRTDGLPSNIMWSAVWSDIDKTVTFTPALGGTLEYLTEYEVYINTLIAKTIRGAPLVNGAIPNPWKFVTTKKLVPDITASYKSPSANIVEAGDTITYIIYIKNTGDKIADVTFLDNIPYNTTYDNYVWNATWEPINNRITWSGNMGVDQTYAIEFRVRVDIPLPNDTIITNEALINDGVNPEISRLAEIIIQSPAAVIMLTSPMAGEQQVSIIPNIRAVFDQTMDRALVEQAFSVVRTDGLPSNIMWSAVWSDIDKTVTFTPALGGTLEYLTEYEVYINTLIAKTIRGAPLVNGAIPNPWKFKTVDAGDPDLSTSEVRVDKDLAKAGDFLTYTIDIRNTSLRADANVFLTNPIPVNTTYAYYISGGIWDVNSNSIIWNGIVKAMETKTIIFMVQINNPVPNGTIITDEAVIDDGINEPLLRFVKTLVQPEIDWETSFKEDENDNPEREPHTAKPGDTLDYTVFVENTGSIEAINVFINDLIPFRTTYVHGSATGGFAYNENKNQLGWFGNILPDENKEFTFKVIISEDKDLFPVEDDLIINEAVILDTDDNFSVQSTTTVIIEDDGGTSNPHLPYLIDVSPEVDATSVKLYSPIMLTFSKAIDPASLNYVVIINNTKINTTNWKIITTDFSSVIVIRPDIPFRSGTKYTIQITEAQDINGQQLSINGPIKDNTWSFVTVRPTIYFEDNALLNLKAGTISEAIIIKLGDWVNYEGTSSNLPKYDNYLVEDASGMLIKLWSTSTTAKFSRTIDGNFDNNSIEILMPYGQDTIGFYYTDPVITSPVVYKMVAYAPYTKYLVYAGFKSVITTIDGEMPDQNMIHFTSDRQEVPVDNLSNPISFEIRNPRGDIVPMKAGKTFLLTTDSSTGLFFNQFKLPLDQYAIYQMRGGGTKLYYKLSVPEDTLEAIMYYKDSTPGPYLMTIDEDYGISSLGVTIAASIIPIQPAVGANQNINILPLDDQDIDLDLDNDLEVVEDDSGRTLAYVKITPDQATLLPGAIRLFEAKGYDEEGQEIDNLIFGWYVIADGGNISKISAHTAVFRAGLIPGIYANTVMVAAFYNGEIRSDMATIKVLDMVEFDGITQLPSTGPSGIQTAYSFGL